MNPQTTPPPIPNPLPPNLPCMDLVTGPRAEYLETGVPLYEASIKCDWKAANAILVKKPLLARYSITENGETALHVAASAKGDLKLMVEFVFNLVGMMDNKDLELQNKNHNTALYLAAAAGNVETVKIMMAKNKVLLTIAGAGETMSPLYAAVLFGHHDVVKYMYENSNLDDDECWTEEKRVWLFEKCVDNDMFDIALKIIEKRPEVASRGKTLAALARKPDAFTLQKSNIIWRFVICVFAFFGLKMGAPEKETEAFPLLRKIWEDIAKKPKLEIDTILRGPRDPKKEEKKSWSVQATRLQVLISKHLAKMKVETKNIINGPPESTSQAIRLQNLITKYLEDMHDETHNIIRSGPVPVKQDNKTSYGKEYQARELNDLISTHIVSMHGETQSLIESTPNEDQLAQKLGEVIYKLVDDMRKKSRKITPKREKVTYSSRVLFIAAEVGNASFLIELIRRYPDLIWKVNDNNETIFHIAVKHRHEGIYNLLYEIGSMKDLITPLKDDNDNNMLHLVGKSAKTKRLQAVSGVALQMQRELLWFQEVAAMIPPSYRERKNKDGLTPYELFTNEHKELVTKGEQWMKETANQCMVVAALIATIVFAAAFTIPGGYNQNTGRPFFTTATFIVFVVADAISLFSSSASILMFLSILTSRYAERDFLEKLPRKLILGLFTLFLSIATMTLAFSVSFFVLYHKGSLWIPILIGVLGVMPVLLYLMLQKSLFLDVIRSTYRSRYLFKPKIHVLYYQNPKV